MGIHNSILSSPWARITIGVALITLVYGLILYWLPYALTGELA